MRSKKEVSSLSRRQQGFMRLWRIQIPLGRHSRLKPVKDRQALLFLGPVENSAQRGPSRLTSGTTYRGWGLGIHIKL
jgi:hypothetical protein